MQISSSNGRQAIQYLTSAASAISQISPDCISLPYFCSS